MMVRMSSYSNKALYEVVKELKVIPKDRLDETFRASEKRKIPLDKLLRDKDLVSDKNLGKVIADLLSTPFVRLSETTINEDVLKIIPENVAKKQKIIAFNKNKRGLHLAMSDPKNSQIRDFVKKKTGANVNTYYATKQDIANALSLYAKDVRKAFDEIIAESVQEAKGAQKTEPSIIKIVDTTIKYAYQNKASDIHIEPLGDKLLIRFRIDGVLHDIVNLPINLQPQIVTRVKVLSKLRTDEHQKAQDGKLVYKTGPSTDGEELDIRVSIVPVTDGEKIAMRLLSERSRQFSLQDLGFLKRDLKKVEQAYQKPHGMILATGPTGSGKTTTLYAILKLLNRRDVNIMTIEDPVEYGVEGVNQIQANPKTGLTFAKGLRSIVRQDPDIILVGEIRDEETADISINAAMTGHLVLSTLHTNDAATSIPRLLDLKVEPFLIASTVNVIIAQRLVRKICQKCRVSQELDHLKREMAKLGENGEGRQSDDSMLKIINKYFGKGKIHIYHGKGCSICHQTGYIGRVGIFETLVVDEAIRQAIIDRRDAAAINELAIKNGMRSMIENGIEKVREGITTIEEVLRVTKE